jgi:hypothetical protein
MFLSIKLRKSLPPKIDNSLFAMTDYDIKLTVVLGSYLSKANS